MSDRPTLVKESWAQKVDDALFSPNGAPAKSDATSLFYDVRPVVLASAWTQNAAGLWVATAKFIINDVVDDSFTFPICAPASSSNPGGSIGTSRYFVVWRGRWEAIALPVGGQTLWTSNPSGGAGADPLPQLTWGCHVEIGKGLALYNAGDCSHGATDGYIVGIKATAGTDAALAYGQFLTGLGTPTTATINTLQNATSTTALASLGEPSTASCLSAEIETETVITEIGTTETTVVTDLGTPTTDTATYISETPTTVEAVTALGTPETAEVLATSKLVDKTVVTAVGSPTTTSVVSGITTSSVEVLTGLGTPTSETINAVQSSATTTALTGLGSPSTDTFLQGTPGSAVNVVTGIQLALNGVAANSVQVLTGVECRNGGVYGIYSTLTLTPSITSIVPIDNPTTASAVTDLGTPTTANVVSSVATVQKTVLTALGTPATTGVNTISGSPSKVDVVASISLETTETIKVPGSNPGVNVVTGYGSVETEEVCAPLTTEDKLFVTELGEPTTETINSVSGSNTTAEVVAVPEEDASVTVLTGLGTQTTVSVIDAATLGTQSVITALGTPTTANAVTGYRE